MSFSPPNGSYVISLSFRGVEGGNAVMLLGITVLPLDTVFPSANACPRVTLGVRLWPEAFVEAP